MYRTPTFTALAVSLLLAGCGEQTPEPGTAEASPATAATGGPTTAITHVDPVPHNDSDTMFAQMMIVHHQGAMEMSQLAAEKADSQEVKDLAAQIEQAQGPEIEKMTQWLQAWGEPVETDAHGHGHAHDESMLMNGKTHEQVMAELQTLEGAAFDKAFLEAMIPHHEGAVTMGEDILENGQNPDVKALAQQIVDSQKAEITEMKTMLSAL